MRLTSLIQRLGFDTTPPTSGLGAGIREAESRAPGLEQATAQALVENPAISGPQVKGRFDAVTAAYVKSLKASFAPYRINPEAEVLSAAGRTNQPIGIDFAREVMGRVLERKELKQAIAFEVQRENADVFEDARNEGKQQRREAEKATQVESFRATFENSTMERLRTAVFGEQALASALRYEAHDDPGIEATWHASVRATIPAVASKTGDPRKRAFEGLESDLAQMAPKSVYAPALERLKGGDQSAVAELQAVVDAAASKWIAPTLSRLAPRGVRSVAMPKLSEGAVYKWSGDMWFPVVMRNFGAGGGVGFGDAMREMAGRLARSGSPMRVLELTTGMGTTALAFTDAQHIRNSGDYMIYDGAKHEAPRLEATVVTPRDLTRAFVNGEAPKSTSEWGTVNAWIANDLSPKTPALQAGYERLKASGALKVREGDTLDVLLGLIKEHQRFDLAIYNELAWNANRMQIVQALQAAMAPGGLAFVPLTSWSPVSLMERAGVDDHVLFADVVKTKSGDVPFAQWLAEKYPSAFEVRVGSGVSALVVKGTVDPVDLPAMDAQPTGATVRHGFPVLRWSPVDGR
jgi:hypothetical protein